MMDSPGKGKNTTSPSKAVATPDSSIFSYISNLSPVKPLKAAPVVPGFPGYSSPPCVFSSPHLNTLRDSNYLKRSQCPQLSGAEVSQQGARGKQIAVGSNECTISKTQGGSELAPRIEKECDNKGLVQDQAASPSRSVDEYLADLVEVDSTNSDHSASLSFIQSGDMPKSWIDCTDLNNLEQKLDNKNDIGQDAEKALGVFQVTLGLPGQEFEGKLSLDNKPVETDKQGGSETLPNVCPKVESDLSVFHDLRGQHREHSDAQNTGAAHKEELDCASRFMPDPFLSTQGYEDCSETIRDALTEPVENMILQDPKGQQHSGMHRRCLQYEEVQLSAVANSPGFRSPNIQYSSNLHANPGHSEVFESSCLEVRPTSSGNQLINLDQPTIPIVSPRNSGNSESTVSKPSGIGLHLNSISSAMPYGCGTSGRMKSSEKDYLNIEGRKFVSTTGCHRPENTKNSSGSLNVREKVSACSEDGSHRNESSVATSSLALLSPQTVKPLNNPALLKQCEYQTTPRDKRKSISEHVDAVEELNPSISKKKRKKASAANDGDGCKHCNCKKTKCLKLYCDCFAAGIYCAEPCSCQDCFNRPEYEDTVLETRQQIESRNPLAFAPKIVQQITESPANSNREDGNNSTPSSARHKRGCSCKKSMCLKKYCECYQANVGCSNGCRCEGCKNVYGRKGEHGMTKDVLSQELESTFVEKLEMVANQDCLLQTELCNPQNLTPLTPSFQFSDHRKDASRSRFFTRICLPSPESNLTFLPPYGKSPGSGNSERHDMSMKDKKDIDDISCHQESDYSNVEAVDEFSPRYDGLIDACEISTMPDPPCAAMASSESSKISNRTTTSSTQLCPGSGHLSSVRSLCWRTTPITPVAHVSGTKLLRAVYSNEKLHDILEDDNGVPDILKDSSTPPNAVKVSSPNKKRISPPRSSLKELGSCASVGLRSGRKFILQAVPSFPPLTPCVDSKDSRSQTLNDHEECSHKK